MLLALTDHLRCTADHADSWLVARADVAERGWMIEGELGCPVCDAIHTVRGGVVFWGGDGRAVPARPAAQPDDESVIRLAALLGLSDGAAPFVLCGELGVHAIALGAIAEVPFVLLDPPDDSAAGLATIIRAVQRLPFGARSVRGVALPAAPVAAEFMSSVLRALAPGGRLVAPADIPVPAGIRELARDDRNWVGERVADGATVSTPVQIGRGAR